MPMYAPHSPAWEILPCSENIFCTKNRHTAARNETRIQLTSHLKSRKASEQPRAVLLKFRKKPCCLMLRTEMSACTTPHTPLVRTACLACLPIPRTNADFEHVHVSANSSTTKDRL